MKKLLSLTLSLMLIISIFAACGKSAPPASEAPSSEAPSTAEPAPAPEEKKEKDPSEMKIAYVSKLQGNQFMSIVDGGVEQAIKDLGITDYSFTSTNLDTDIEKQMQLLQDAVATKPDAILLVPTDSTAMDKPVSEVVASGIPVILLDTRIPSDNYSAALLTNNYEAGKMCGEVLMNLLKEAGVKEDEAAQIGIQVSSMGSQTISDRVNGLYEYWDANAPEAWELLKNDIKMSEGDINKAIGFTQDLITTYPNLKAMFSPANSATVGCSTGLKESGRTDIILLGFDYSTEVAELIETTDLNVTTVLQRAHYMGYEGVKTAVDIVNGKMPAEKFIDTGVIVVNKANVNDPDVQAIVNAGK